MKIKHLRKSFISILLSAALAVGGISFSAAFTSNASEATVYYGLADDIQDGVILHCFDWTYQQIIDELPDIAAAGFTSVQTSPAQAAVTGNSIWYYLYQPNGFYISNSGLGSEDDLKKLCSAADEYGIKVIVDVVANHLAGDHSNIDSSLKDSQYWHWYGDSIDYSNRYAITHGNIGMQDLNSEHSTVQAKVKNYIQQLKSDGVDGIRWDAAKHISLPSESCSFWSSVIDQDMFNYGEILDNTVENNQTYANSLINEYTNYMSVTDSKFSSTILGAINDGSVSNSIGYWTQVAGVSDDKLVYWAESHDTYSNHTSEGGWTKYIDQNKIDRAYAVVASKNGASSLYFSRPSQTEKTSIMVGQKGSTHFESAEVAAVNHFHNACIGEADYYTVSGNVSVTTRESGAVLVLGSGSNQYVEVPNGGIYTTPGTYIDEISGNTFTVTPSTISGTIGSTGIAVFYKVDSTEEEPASTEKRVIYLDTNNCSWFSDNSAVAAIKTNKDSSYTEMTTTTIDGNTVYTASVPANATLATIVRMLPSGAYYNELTISLSSSYNYYTADSNWSYVTTSTYTSVSESDDEDTDLDADDEEAEDDDVEDATDLITVYFSDNYNWGTVYAYTWGGSENTDSWPGTKMTYVSTNQYNEKIYSIEIASDVTGLIFNDGNGNQTVDITSNLSDGQGYYLTSSDSKCSVATYTYNE